jgi:hypothetical protein
MVDNLPSGTVTFLFTDIEGSTKLSQQYPDVLNDSDFAKLSAKGQAMTMEEAIALALKEWGVAKDVGLRSRGGERDSEESVVCRVACY